MDFLHRVRVVEVKKGVEAVAAFVSQVPNLPRWTHFYKQVGASDGARYAVETLMGPAKTAIQEEHLPWVRRYTIVSAFANRTERATLELRPRNDGTQVRFHLRVPRRLGHEHLTRLMEGVTKELLVLKQLLEEPRSPELTTSHPALDSERSAPPHMERQ